MSEINAVTLRHQITLILYLLQGLFYKVMNDEVNPYRLVRLSAEEMISKEISEWRKPETSEVITTLKLTWLKLIIGCIQTVLH